jgi:hypothetical protein
MKKQIVNFFAAGFLVLPTKNAFGFNKQVGRKHFLSNRVKKMQVV